MHWYREPKQDTGVALSPGHAPIRAGPFSTSAEDSARTTTSTGDSLTTTKPSDFNPEFAEALKERAKARRKKR